MNKWYRQSGAEGDVAVSTRIRLARNLYDYPFPAGMAEDLKEEITDQIREACKNQDLKFIDMKQVSHREALSMVERHLISPDFAVKSACGLMLSEDESVSIMICEEDHLRMQILGAGMQLQSLYEKLDALDTALDASLHFAFDERLGYLTECPTNLGTGMRASLMLHLPALQEQNNLGQLANLVSKLGLTIRGLYGEGTKPEGGFYQLSNQVTLGISEQAAIDNLQGIAAQIIAREREVREAMRGPGFEDRLWRSLGLLQTARLLTNSEFMGLISNVRLGAAMEILPIPLDTVTALINDAQPAALMTRENRDLMPEERDRLRAELVRHALTNKIDN